MTGTFTLSEDDQRRISEFQKWMDRQPQTERTAFRLYWAECDPMGDPPDWLALHRMAESGIAWAAEVMAHWRAEATKRDADAGAGGQNNA